MRVNTIGNVAYVVTSSGACTVTTDVNGTAVTLASIGANGGQASFMAVSGSVEVSDTAAMVLPYLGTDVPLGMGGGITAEQTREMMESVLYETAHTETRSTTGTDNYNCQSIVLDAVHVPESELVSIGILCRNGSASSMAADAVYLTVYEAEGDGWVRLGSSTNAVVQTSGTRGVWEFDNLTLRGRALRFCLNSTPDGEWNTSLGFGVRVTAAPSGDESKCNNAAYIADVIFDTVEQVAKFTPLSHAQDTVCHITAAERTAWNGKAEASALNSKLNSSTFTTHQNNTTLHLTAAEHTGLTALLERKDDLLALLNAVSSASETENNEPEE